MTIDWWTLGFQTVNVVVLIWLLGHFFWKPVAGMIEARRAEAQKLTDDAKATGAKADAALADVEKTRAGFAGERAAILADAHKVADEAGAVLLAKAKTDAEALTASAKADITKDAKAQEDLWAEHSDALAIDVAARLAARLDGGAVQQCFLTWLTGAVRSLPEADRKAAGAAETTLELTCAVALDAAGQADCRTLIAAALGGDPQLSFRTDAGLIAGYELHGDHLIVSSSWRADLGTIRASLAK